MANFFHTPKPRQFRIQPRFWDPEKEERKARYRRAEAEMGRNKADGEYKPYIGRGDFKKGLSNSKWSPETQKRKTNTRLLILIGLAVALVWFMLR